MTRHVLIAGATGEVGRALVARATAQAEVSVRALVRRPGTLPAAPNLQEIPFDYEDGAAFARVFSEPCDLLFIALGTTRGKAGSDEAFLRVDRDYPLRLISAMATAHPEGRIGLVSSVGAETAKGLYLGAKAAVEEELAQSGLAFAIARPSLLRSSRREFRPVEVAADWLLSPLVLLVGRWFLPRSQGWWRWAPVHVREVAAALFEATLALAPRQQRILEGLDLHPGPVGRWGRPA